MGIFNQTGERSSRLAYEGNEFLIEPPNLGSDYDPVARMLGEAPQTYRDGDAVFYLQECFSAIADGTPYWQATYVKRQKPPVREGSVSD